MACRAGWFLLSAPDRAVVAIGDGGGFNVMLGEIETARRVGRNT